MGQYRVDNHQLESEVGALVEQGVIDLGQGPKVPVHWVWCACDLMFTDSKVSLWYRWGWPSRTVTWSQSTGGYSVKIPILLVLVCMYVGAVLMGV